jgi:hypothetical protein
MDVPERPDSVPLEFVSPEPILGRSGQRHGSRGQHGPQPLKLPLMRQVKTLTPMVQEMVAMS